jgi:crotonobetainyl-CoA:carnitine CoA-transferase CaiB-like acyl-CoA transferase
VLLENYRPGVAARLGFGPAGLLERNPRLVYCSISGWGQDGPWAQRAAYAPLVHAEVGILELAARVRGEPIRQEVHQHGDVYPGVVACSAILGALLQRERSGRGQHLDVSMSEVAVYVNDHAAIDLIGYRGERAFDTWTFATLPLADGTSVHLLGNPTRVFGGFAAALGEPDLAHQPRFANPTAIEANLGAALVELRRLMARVPDFAALETRLRDTKLLYAQVRSLSELAETPWAHSRGLVAELGPGLRVPRAAWRGSDQSLGAGPVRARGADNARVLGELLGLSAEEIESLEKQGVLCSAP